MCAIVDLRGSQSRLASTTETIWNPICCYTAANLVRPQGSAFSMTDLQKISVKWIWNLTHQMFCPCHPLEAPRHRYFDRCLSSGLRTDQDRWTEWWYSRCRQSSECKAPGKTPNSRSLSIPWSWWAVCSSKSFYWSSWRELLWTVGNTWKQGRSVWRSKVQAERGCQTQTAMLTCRLWICSSSQTPHSLVYSECSWRTSESCRSGTKHQAHCLPECLIPEKKWQGETEFKWNHERIVHWQPHWNQVPKASYRMLVWY